MITGKKEDIDHNDTVMDRFSNHGARIEKMIYLAGVLGESEAFSEDAKEFLFESDWEDLENTLGEIPQYVKDAFSDDREYELIEWMFTEGKLGFAVQFATPVRTPVGDNAANMSWGHYYTKWVYGNTVNDAMEAGFKWCSDMKAKDLAKAA